MEPADIMKISMNVGQAQEILFGGRESCLLRSAALEFASRLCSMKPTPAQAQAALVLAWNEVLGRSKLSSLDG